MAALPQSDLWSKTKAFDNFLLQKSKNAQTEFEVVQIKSFGAVRQSMTHGQQE